MIDSTGKHGEDGLQSVSREVKKRFPFKLTTSQLLKIFELKIDVDGNLLNRFDLRELTEDEVSNKIIQLGEKSDSEMIKDLLKIYNKMVQRRDKNIYPVLRELTIKGLFDLSKEDPIEFAQIKKIKKSHILKVFAVKILQYSLWLLSNFLKIVLDIIKITLREIFCVFSLIVVLIVAIFKLIFGPTEHQSRIITVDQWADFGRNNFDFSKHELKKSWGIIFKASFFNGGNLCAVVDVDKKETKRQWLLLEENAGLQYQDGIVPSVYSLSDFQSMLLGSS